MICSVDGCPIGVMGGMVWRRRLAVQLLALAIVCVVPAACSGNGSSEPFVDGQLSTENWESLGESFENGPPYDRETGMAVLTTAAEVHAVLRDEGVDVDRFFTGRHLVVAVSWIYGTGCEELRIGSIVVAGEVAELRYGDVPAECVDDREPKTEVIAIDRAAIGGVRTIEFRNVTLDVDL
jgi:hypothetical protein